MNNNPVLEAKEIAEKVHGNQADKKEYPYMAHILDVASRVSHLGENYEITGLLHDAIEDASKHPNGEKFKKEITSQIEKSFSNDVIEAIHAMTKLSHFHFTTNNEATKRIINMGEEKWRVKNFGYSAMDYVKLKNYAKKSEIEDKLKIKITKVQTTFLDWLVVVWLLLLICCCYC